MNNISVEYMSVVEGRDSKGGEQESQTQNLVQMSARRIFVGHPRRLHGGEEGTERTERI